MGRVRTKTVKKVRIRVRPPTPHPARRGVPRSRRRPDARREKSAPETGRCARGSRRAVAGYPSRAPDATRQSGPLHASSARQRDSRHRRGVDETKRRRRASRRSRVFGDTRVSPTSASDAGSERVDAERRRAHEALRSIGNFERPARLWETSSVRPRPRRRASLRARRSSSTLGFWTLPFASVPGAPLSRARPG